VAVRQAVENEQYLAGTLAALLLFLAGASAGQANDSASSDLVVEVGRLHAMLGKSEILLKVGESDKSAPAGDTVRETDDPFVLLKDAVIRYDRDVSDACRRNAIAGPICNDFLAPWWLAAGTRPPDSRLQDWIEATSRHITPFWKEACRINGAGVDPSLCEIE
jgi:hypothetical protein